MFFFLFHRFNHLILCLFRINLLNSLLLDLYGTIIVLKKNLAIEIEGIFLLVNCRRILPMKIFRRYLPTEIFSQYLLRELQ